MLICHEYDPLDASDENQNVYATLRNTYIDLTRQIERLDNGKDKLALQTEWLEYFYVDEDEVEIIYADQIRRWWNK